MIQAFAFDLFGTLIDNTSIKKVFPEVGISVAPKPFIETWRSKHLQYAWLLTILNRYESFSELSLRALKFTAKIYGIDLSEVKIRKITEARMHLEAFPDSKKGLIDLKKAKGKDNKCIYCILSNSEAAKTSEILRNSGLDQYFDHILSVESVRKYKPSKEAYIMASEILRIPLSEIVMVSSNPWDLAGAKSAGMLTCLIARGDNSQLTFDQIDVKLDYYFSSMDELNQIKELT
jgi:2-haloacid dehalogenase